MKKVGAYMYTPRQYQDIHACNIFRFMVSVVHDSYRALLLKPSPGDHLRITRGYSAFSRMAETPLNPILGRPVQERMSLQPLRTLRKGAHYL